MMQEQLNAIKARCKAATSGKWEYDERKGVFIACHTDNSGNLSAKPIITPVGNHNDDPHSCITVTNNDVDFIIHARDDVFALLAELEKNPWIPVDRMGPEVNDEQNEWSDNIGIRLIVMDCDGFVTMATYWKDAKKFTAYGINSDNITHWCPLPEAPVEIELE